MVLPIALESIIAEYLYNQLQYAVALFQSLAILSIRLQMYTIQDNIGATRLISEPQLEFTAIIRVKIECHR